MSSLRPLVVREIQLAHALGFTDVEPFRRALKSGDIPAPNEYLGGRPVWYLPDLTRRYGAGAFDDLAVGEGKIMDRIKAEF